GVESMSRVPMGSDYAPFSERLQDRFELYNQGIAAELMCDRWNLSRQALDVYSVESHRKAMAAIDASRFEAEIVPIARPDGTIARTDQGPRRDTNLAALDKLKPAFRDDGRITAGNSSQITDGASALLVGTEALGKRHGLRPLARFVATAVAGVDPTLMLAGPVPATAKVLRKAELPLEQIALFEVNEAFAPVPMAWLHETGADPARLNVNGGAIALGHPLGCTGARLLTSIVHELHRRKARYGLVTMCIGLGQATATIIERM
ncbi:MAG: thiolase family protein, partial [Planctomycetes bacterium]|nr:thiolase family protein [Planctomycetota bacterium]